MPNRIRLTPCLALLVAFSVLGSAGAWADDAKMVGNWFCNTVPAEGFGLLGTEMLLTAGARGTLRTSETDDMTGFNPTLGSQGFVTQTSGAGGWKKAKGRTFDLNYMQLGFIGVGEDAGLFSSLARFRCSVKLHRDSMKGACDADVWFAVDPDGDGIPNSPNPVTTDPDFVIPDIGTMACDRIPVMPK